METSQRKAQFAASLFLIGGVVLVAVPFWPGARDPMIPIRILLLAAWTGAFGLVFLSKRGGDRGAFPSSRWFRGFLLAFVGLLGVGVLATTQAQVPQESLIALLKWGLLYGWFLLASLTLTHFPQSKSLLLKAMVPLAGLLALLGCLQAVTQLPIFPSNPQLPSSTFFYRNLFGSALFLCFPFLLWHLFQENRAWKIAAMGVALLCLLTLFLCRSGNAMLALFLFFPLFLQIQKQRAGNSKATIWFRALLNPLTLFIGLLILLVSIFLIRFPGSTLQQRYRLAVPEYENIQPRSNSMQERAILWRKSARMAKDHPGLGVGPGNWKIRISQYGLIAMNQRYGDRFFMRPHNDFLGILVEYGVLGLLTWIGMWVCVLGFAAQRIRKEKDRAARTELAAWVYGLCGYAFISLFSYPGDRMFHPVMLLLFCALIFSHAPSPKGKTTSKWNFWLIPVLLVSLLNLVAGVEMVRVNHWLGKKEAVHSPLVKLDPLTAQPIMGIAAKAEFEKGNIESAEKQNAKALKLNPWHIQTLYLQVQILEAQGKTDEAKAAWQALQELYPQFRRE